jgi:hypothetical protein
MERDPILRTADAVGLLLRKEFDVDGAPEPEQIWLTLSKLNRAEADRRPWPRAKKTAGTSLR